MKSTERIAAAQAAIALALLIVTIISFLGIMNGSIIAVIVAAVSATAGCFFADKADANIRRFKEERRKEGKE